MLGLLGATVFLGIMYNEVRMAGEKLGSLADIIDKIQTEPSRVVTSDGKVIYQVSDEYRKPVRLSEVPKVVQQAVLAAEDKRFYEHQGVDLWALGRTLRENVREGRKAQGGSTLTMQLAKRLFTNSGKSYQRKMDDIALAMALEQRLTKDQILELYLNQVYFGEGATGIKAAAEIYLSKSLSQLTASDAALLSRCVRRPSHENPFKNLKRSIENRNIVLATMRDEGMLSLPEYQRALSEKPRLNKSRTTSTARRQGAPYFVDYILDQVAKDPALADVDLESGGYTVETTLDYSLQLVAEKSVRDVVNANRNRGIGTGAFLLTDSEGKILVMVGGKDFQTSQVNIVTQAFRQPGSAFKPILYASALRAGAVSQNEYFSTGPYHYVDPTTQEPWDPKNSVRFSSSSASLRSALAFSINTVAARIIEKVGPQQVVLDAKSSFGFTSPRISAVPSLSLGACDVRPIEMAEAYSVFMLRGDRATPFGIKRILGPDGSVVKSFSPNIVRGVFDTGVCEIIDGFMRAVVTEGTGAKANVIPEARGKTGTTNDGRDAWFCGYAKGMVGIGWVGNVIPKPTREVYGGQVTVNIWTAVMKAAYAKYGESKAPEVYVGTSNAKPEEQKPAEDVANNEEMKPAPLPDRDAEAVRNADSAGDIPIAEDPVIAQPDEQPIQEEPKQDPPRLDPPKVEPPRRPRTEPRPRRQPVSEQVSVEVCAETGDRASIYCPETVVRTFQKGQEPRRRCQVHGTGEAAH